MNDNPTAEASYSQEPAQVVVYSTRKATAPTFDRVALSLTLIQLVLMLTLLGVVISVTWLSSQDVFADAWRRVFLLGLISIAAGVVCFFIISYIRKTSAVTGSLILKIIFWTGRTYPFIIIPLYLFIGLILLPIAGYADPILILEILITFACISVVFLLMTGRTNFIGTETGGLVRVDPNSSYALPLLADSMVDTATVSFFLMNIVGILGVWLIIITLPLSSFLCLALLLCATSIKFYIRRKGRLSA